ncbi:Queuine tRNA-ribosyltransferase accessory subunit 2 [Cladobotryum mycophilum]|uniref:Queuine tRNA-ribosyltransferase accessory subunit 2 n=1 Tax=Cladobotryum mycophilum TaxID=491253 RepID=A0ABR0SM52_9HYPO
MSEHEQQQTSSDMSSRKIFETSAGLTARLGRLSLPNRKLIETPTFIVATSRGVVPHLTPDNLKKYSSVNAVYMGLEDFIEKKDSPVFQTPNGDARRLHSFTALPSEVITVLGPRRCPAVTTPVGNTVKTISVFTSTGFRNVTVPEYASAIESLQPDIVLPMADLPHTSTTPVSKKLVRMVEHTEVWMDEFFKQLSPKERLDNPGISVFAPVLPVEYPIQWDYLRYLSEDVREDISGLAVYSTNIVPELINYPSLIPLPKISMDLPKTPHDVLRQIALGIDICTLPFVNNVSDSGVALTFSFPAWANKGVQPLGINMWSPEHSTAVVPLAEGCQCYACTKHHRAYLQHLLNAKEMLGWNLLQIHNYNVINEFFKGIRESLSKGPEQFENDRQKFLAMYEPSLPEGTGARPRARGYHFKSEANQDKINQPSWTDLDKSGGATPGESGTTVSPEGNGQGDTLIPNVDKEAIKAVVEDVLAGALEDK